MSNEAERGAFEAAYKYATGNAAGTFDQHENSYVSGVNQRLFEYFQAGAAYQRSQSALADLVLVPIKPTPEMIAAGDEVEDLYKRGTPDTWGKVYRAMLAAAPKAEPVQIYQCPRCATSMEVDQTAKPYKQPEPVHSSPCGNDELHSEFAAIQMACPACAAMRDRLKADVQSDQAHELALKVRAALDRTSCPDAWMRIAYESVVANFAAPQPSDDVAKALKTAANRMERLALEFDGDWRGYATEWAEEALAAFRAAMGEKHE